MGNVSKLSINVYAKFRCALLRIKKALGIFRELITTTTTTITRVAFWDPPSGSKNPSLACLACSMTMHGPYAMNTTLELNAAIRQYTKGRLQPNSPIAGTNLQQTENDWWSVP